MRVFLDLETQRQALIRLMAEREAAAKERLRLESEVHQAQRMEVVGRLTSGVAHDFNNILAGIFVNAEVLQMQLDEILSGQQRELLAGILQAGEDGRSLPTRARSNRTW